MSTLHTIKAYLYENTLTDDPNDYVARVNAERSLSIKDICEAAKARGGADISANAMEHAVELWFKEMVYQLCDGYSINTGYFAASTHIKGVFNSPNEMFNHNKHSILFEFHQGAQLRKEIENVVIDILGVADASLSIAQVVDVKTGSVNELLTPNRNLRISGHRLKIAGANPDNGVYFINQGTQERIKVDVSDIVNNNPSELIIVLPDLPSGNYTLEVVTQYAISVLLKAPRTCVFDKMLTVL